MGQERDDYADPDLPRSRLPTLGLLAAHAVLVVLFAVVVAALWWRWWALPTLP